MTRCPSPRSSAFERRPAAALRSRPGSEARERNYAEASRPGVSPATAQASLDRFETTSVTGSAAVGPRPPAPLPPLSPDEIGALSGPLSKETLARLAPVLPWLSSSQLEHLDASTDLSKRAQFFARTTEVRHAIDRLLRAPSNAYEGARAIVRHELELGRCHLTPELAARLAAILLTGTVTQHLKDDLRWARAGFLGSVGDLLPVLPRGNVAALNELIFLLALRPHSSRELFLRAFAYELGRYEDALLARLVRTVGLPKLRAIAPSSHSEQDETFIQDLTQLDRLEPYFACQRSAVKVEPWSPSEDIGSLISRAETEIARADDFARAHAVTLASQPDILDEARAHYADVREIVKRIVQADARAVRHPVVKAWMTRRARALFVASAFREVTRGIDASKRDKLVGVARATVTRRPTPKGESKIDPALARALAASVGGPLAHPDEAHAHRILEALSKRLLAEATPDPLISVMLPAERPSIPHVHLVFAPGIIPLGGVLESAFIQLERDTGVKTTIAATGLFDSAERNAAAIEQAMKSVLDQDPEARFVLVGYSQGAANILTSLDSLRTRDRNGLALAERTLGVGSLYGAHNGSIVADGFLPGVHALMRRVPFGDRIEVGLSALSPVARFVAGGIGSMKRVSRQRFWKIANLPDDIPYVAITAHPEGEASIPNLLLGNHRSVLKTATALGLDPENDAQVLASDGPLGNLDSGLGRSIRESCVELRVRGHHWNPLSPEHVPIDSALKFAFPKSPQIEVFIELLGEVGSLDRA